jgi:hypothetical protein
MITELIQHPYFQLAVAILAPLSILISYVLYRKSLRVRLPHYVLVTRDIVSQSRTNLPDLTFAYRGHPQKQVSITRLVIWNEGKETVRQTDIASNDPLRLELPDGVSALDATVVRETSRGVHAQVNPRSFDEKAVLEISFDFLDYQDGFLVQVIHNGGAKDRLRVRGRIAGARLERSFPLGDRSSFERSTTRMTDLFSKSPRLFTRLAFSMYALFAAIGLSLWIFVGRGPATFVLTAMAFPAAVMLPLVIQRVPPINVDEERKD